MYKILQIHECSYSEAKSRKVHTTSFFIKSIKHSLKNVGGCDQTTKTAKYHFGNIAASNWDPVTSAQIMICPILGNSS